MSRRLILFSALGASIALLVTMQAASPLVIDLCVRLVDAMLKAPFGLIFIVALLGLTMAAGAWATMRGILSQAKRMRLGRRRRVRLY